MTMTGGDCHEPIGSRNDAHTNNVIPNVVKHLSESTDVRLLCYPIDPSLRSGQKHSEEIATSGKALLAMTHTHKHTNNVILNVVKNLLNDNTLSTLSMVGCEEIATSGDALLAMTEYSISLAMMHTLTTSF